MTDFNAGDKLSATITDEDGKVHTREFWVGLTDDGEQVSFVGNDPYCPNVLISDIVADPDITVELVARCEDQLPAEPGLYDEEMAIDMRAIIGMIGVGEDNPLVEGLNKPWILSEDGEWTDPQGETRPSSDNWLLTSHGFSFVPWEGATV